jgi:hypothetical protein
MDDKWLRVPVLINKKKDVGIYQLVIRWSKNNNKREREKEKGKKRGRKIFTAEGINDRVHADIHFNLRKHDFRPAWILRAQSMAGFKITVDFFHGDFHLKLFVSSCPIPRNRDSQPTLKFVMGQGAIHIYRIMSQTSQF